MNWQAWVLLALVLPVLFRYGPRAWRSYGRWRAKSARLDAINKEYEMLRSVRQDAVYHHGWANSRGDYREAESHEKHVMEIDLKLDLLRRQYTAIEAGQLEEADVV